MIGRGFDFMQGAGFHHKWDTDYADHRRKKSGTRDREVTFDSVLGPLWCGRPARRKSIRVDPCSSVSHFLR